MPERVLEFFIHKNLIFESIKEARADLEVLHRQASLQYLDKLESLLKKI